MLLHCLFALIASTVCMKQYTGNKVIRIELKTEEDIEKGVKLQRYLESLQVDIWHEVSPLAQSGFLDFLLPAELTPLLDNSNLTYRVFISDVQELIDKVKVTRVKREADVTSFHQNYHNLTEIQDWMQSMAVSYRNLVQVFPITESFEGRKLDGLKISTGSAGSKAEVWLQAGLHAREWIAPASVMFLVHELLRQYGSDPNITALLDSVDVYAVPVVNVDGYVYTFTDERLWRKTRTIHPGKPCVGVDANRNWDFQWEGSEEGSNISCHVTYQGPAPFSEKVVKGVADYVQRYTRNVVAFLDFHSYGQLWLSPWGFSRNNTVDWEHQWSATKAAADAIKSVHGRTFTTGQIAQRLYFIRGGVTDWAYAVLNVTFSVGAELRDTGRYGFLMPPEEIIPSGEETLQGVLAYIQYVNSHHDFIRTAGTPPPTNDGSISNGCCCCCCRVVTCIFLCCFVLLYGIVNL